MVCFKNKLASTCSWFVLVYWLKKWCKSLVSKLTLTNWSVKGEWHWRRKTLPNVSATEALGENVFISSRQVGMTSDRQQFFLKCFSSSDSSADIRPRIRQSQQQLYERERDTRILTNRCRSNFVFTSCEQVSSRLIFAYFAFSLEKKQIVFWKWLLFKLGRFTVDIFALPSFADLSVHLFYSQSSRVHVDRCPLHVVFPLITPMYTHTQQHWWMAM